GEVEGGRHHRRRARRLDHRAPHLDRGERARLTATRGAEVLRLILPASAPPHLRTIFRRADRDHRGSGDHASVYAASTAGSIHGIEPLRILTKTSSGRLN